MAGGALSLWVGRKVLVILVPFRVHMPASVC